MDSSTRAFLLLTTCMLSIASATIEPDCGSCSKPKHNHPIVKPPTTGVPLPPVTLPPVPLPPVTLPPVTLPPVTVPKVPLLPPVTTPPVLTPPKETPCAPPSPPAKPDTCPIDTLKLGACVDLLGGLVHVVLGDPAVHECCPVLSGLLELEAAACLCTTIKLKALNLNIYIPIALQVLAICGKTPPPGYTCPV
ncbi:hypothetical protein F511_44104 [Dorcoceras hygrometricum]|uniref:Bifunctional inhibitor/plant lipid transfer protein/seed storage helical domain-containing protein n=1 Tax=Dorcoceras hygrometricum TaxID=472368 RepID=A0A2Z7A5K4_9LAMI|nr:hypothetical protein F511_44457 [Dorcoceras hygrometricum]KZV14235.1 hypothetical protein F511_44104 [Dorcoceras hygrometricum]